MRTLGTRAGFVGISPTDLAYFTHYYRIRIHIRYLNTIR